MTKPTSQESAVIPVTERVLQFIEDYDPAVAAVVRDYDVRTCVFEPFRDQFCLLFPHVPISIWPGDVLAGPRAALLVEESLQKFLQITQVSIPTNEIPNSPTPTQQEGKDGKAKGADR